MGATLTNRGLWNRNFCLIILADMLLYASVYMLFPVLHGQIMAAGKCTDLQAGWGIVVFGLGVFVPGMLNAYLVDRFPRKSVCAYSILALGVLTLAYPYVSGLWQVGLLRGLQGACYGIALMSMGSTLAIDVTPTHFRDHANVNFTWSGLIGMFLGVLFGLDGLQYVTFQEFLWISAILSFVAVMLVAMVDVCFRAPLEVPFFSFDRFLLFRALVPGLNMAVVPVILGIILGTVSDSGFYICMCGGFVVFLLIGGPLTSALGGRILNGLGFLLVLASIGVLGTCEDGASLWGAGMIAGLGMGFSLFQFLRMMILLPLHCERGTGYHTYQLLWCTGVIGGYLLGRWQASATDTSPFVTAFCIGTAGLLFYQLFVHRYYIDRLKENNII